MLVFWILMAPGIISAVVFLVGSCMPARYEGRTVVRFDQPLEAVWEALQDVDAHPMTGKMKKSIESLADGEAGPIWKEDMGRGEIITVETILSVPNERMVREMSSGSANMTSRWEYQLVQQDRGCEVTLTGVTHIEKGTWHTPLFRVMMKLGGGVKKGLDIQLDMVAASLKAGA